MRRDSHPMVRPYGHLKLITAGLVLGLIGIVRILSGIQVVTHWTGQPLFSWGLIAAGGICLLLAVIPVSWIAKAANSRLNAKR